MNIKNISDLKFYHEDLITQEIKERHQIEKEKKMFDISLNNKMYEMICRWQ